MSSSYMAEVMWPRSDRSRHARVGLAVLAAIVTTVFFLDFCNLMFACGCRSWWNGADADCNIHHPGPRHCPWCSLGFVGSSAVWFAIVGAQAFFALRASGSGWPMRVLLTFLPFPALGSLAAVAAGLAVGYWT